MKWFILMSLLLLNSCNYFTPDSPLDGRKTIKIGYTRVVEEDIISYTKKRIWRPQNVEFIRYDSEANLIKALKKDDVNIIFADKTARSAKLSKKYNKRDYLFIPYKIYSYNYESIKGVKGRIYISNKEENKTRTNQLLVDSGFLSETEAGYEKNIENIEIVEIENPYELKNGTFIAKSGARDDLVDKSIYVEDYHKGNETLIIYNRDEDVEDFVEYGFLGVNTKAYILNSLSDQVKLIL